jgi:hyperosmotically inducible protein
MQGFNKIAVVILCVGIFTAFFGCQTPAGRTAGEVVDDATITTKIKALLLNDEIISGFGVSITTFEGDVTLTGAVDSSATKKKAEDIAKSVYGVKSVKNLIKIK